jgi:putative membrane protein
MAGLLYLPRLFVYHCENQSSQDLKSIFKTMEHRLYKYIMNPAAILTWISGIYLVIDAQFYMLIWFKLKFILIICLTIFHIYMYKILNTFKNDLNNHPPRFFRLINEIPTLLMILIVALVVIKPNLSF